MPSRRAIWTGGEGLVVKRLSLLEALADVPDPRDPRGLVLAAVRNTAIHLLAGSAWPSKAAATRRYAAHPHEALALLQTA